MRGEELADDAPDDGPPRRGVEGDEEAREDDHGGARGGGRGGIGVVEREGPHGREDEEVDRHADAADDQGPASPEPLHDVQARERHAEVDAAQNHGCHVAVADAGGLEDGGAVVEEEVGPLRRFRSQHCLFEVGIRVARLVPGVEWSSCTRNMSIQYQKGNIIPEMYVRSIAAMLAKRCRGRFGRPFGGR